MSATSNPLFAPFFAGVVEGELRFPRCADCGAFHWYPKARCPFCASAALSWVSVDLGGTLFSWTTVRHAFAPEFQGRLPYTVGLVEFAGAPGVRLVVQVAMPSGEEPCCGLPVRAVLATEATGAALVTVVPVTGG